MTDQLKSIIDNAEEVTDTLIKMNSDIRKLDEDVNNLITNVKEKTLLYCKNQRKLSRDAKTKAAKEIQLSHAEIVEKSQKKAEIASKMYEFIDQNIRNLDEQTTKFNKKMIKKTVGEQKKLNKNNQNTPGSSGRGRGRKKIEKVSVDFSPDFKPLQLEAADMPVNPNEPRYCICHQVSFGEMIACDNPTCKYEWFHYQCLGIEKAPPGEFICKFCKEKGFTGRKGKQQNSKH